MKKIAIVSTWFALGAISCFGAHVFPDNPKPDYGAFFGQLNRDSWVCTNSVSESGIDSTNRVNYLINKYDETNLTARINAKQDAISDYTTTGAVQNIVTGYGFETSSHASLTYQTKIPDYTTTNAVKDVIAGEGYIKGYTETDPIWTANSNSFETAIHTWVDGKNYVDKSVTNVLSGRVDTLYTSKQDKIADYTTTNAVKNIASSASVTNAGAVAVLITATNDLTEAITNKADKSELAGYLPLTGGTMTGDITLSSGVNIDATEGSVFFGDARLLPYGIMFDEGGGFVLWPANTNNDTFAVKGDIPTIPSTTSLFKGNGSGGIVAATADSDYLTPNTANVNFVPWVTDDKGDKTSVTIGDRVESSAGQHSLVNGYSSSAVGKYSHAEGWITSASGQASHSDGNNTIASGFAAYSGGCYSYASNDVSFAWSGFYLANKYGSHGTGTFNINPVGGLSGFYIGEQNLTQITNKILTTAENTAGTKIDRGYTPTNAVVALSRSVQYVSPNGGTITVLKPTAIAGGIRDWVIYAYPTAATAISFSNLPHARFADDSVTNTLPENVYTAIYLTEIDPATETFAIGRAKLEKGW